MLDKTKNKTEVKIVKMCATSFIALIYFSYSKLFFIVEQANLTLVKLFHYCFCLQTLVYFTKKKSKSIHCSLNNAN